MRWLLHGDVTFAAAEALRRHGHKTVSLTEIAPGAATIEQILTRARELQLDVITTDAALAGAPYESGVAFDRTLIFLQLAGGEVEQDDAIDRLFARYKRLSPGRMYTVTGTRVKVRQLPTASTK
ncbi:MAG: hypothetical protein ACREJC_15125 [Tepidisphaeraceae bacterium]